MNLCIACEQSIFCGKSYSFIHEEYGVPGTTLIHFLLTINTILQVKKSRIQIKWLEKEWSEEIRLGWLWKINKKTLSGLYQLPIKEWVGLCCDHSWNWSWSLTSNGHSQHVSSFSEYKWSIRRKGHQSEYHHRVCNEICLMVNITGEQFQRITRSQEKEVNQWDCQCLRTEQEEKEADRYQVSLDHVS